MGDDDLVDDSSSSECGATCPSLHLQTQEAQSGSTWQARQRVQVAYSGTDARQQVLG